MQLSAYLKYGASKRSISYAERKISGKLRRWGDITIIILWICTFSGEVFGFWLQPHHEPWFLQFCNRRAPETIRGTARKNGKRIVSGMRRFFVFCLVKFDVLDEIGLFDEIGDFFAGFLVADGLDFGDGQLIVVGAVMPVENVAWHDGIFAV